MTAELVRGQNHPLPQTRLEIRVSAGTPVVACATLGDEQGRVRGARVGGPPGSPTLPGLEVSRQAAADHRLAVDLEAMPEARAPGATCCSRCRPGRRGPAVSAPSPRRSSPSPASTAPRSPATPSPVSTPSRRSSPWSSTAGRAPGRSAPSARGTRAASPSCSPTRACRRPRSSPARSRRRSGSAPGPLGGRRPRPVRRRRRPGPRRRRRSARPGRRRRRPRRIAAPPAPRRPRAPPTSGRVRSQPAGRPPAGGRSTTRTPAPAARRPAAPPPAAPPGRARRARAARRGRRHRLVHGRAAVQPGVGHVRGPGPHRRRLPQRRRLRRLAHGAGAGPRSCPTRAAAWAPRATRPARRPAPSATNSSTRPGRPSTGTSPSWPPSPRSSSPRCRPRTPAGTTRSGTPTGSRWRSRWPLRLGDLQLPEQPELRIPMLVRLPLERGLWIDSGPHGGSEAAAFAGRRRRSRASRWTPRWRSRPGCSRSTRRASSPSMSSTRRARPRPALAPLVRAGVLAAPPGGGRRRGGRGAGPAHRARGPGADGGAGGAGADALPPGLDTAEQLLIVNDFPHGFDDRAVTQLRYLADEGPGGRRPSDDGRRP